MNHTAEITTTSEVGQSVDLAPLVGYLTIAEAAERAGLTPWQVHELAEAGRLDAVGFNGRTYVSARAVATLA